MTVWDVLALARIVLHSAVLAAVGLVLVTHVRLWLLMPRSIGHAPAHVVLSAVAVVWYGVGGVLYAADRPVGWTFATAASFMLAALTAVYSRQRREIRGLRTLRGERDPHRD